MRYSCQQITAEDEAAVLEVLRSDYLTQGPVVERFEAALAEYVGAKHAVCVSSGTAALHLAYLGCGGFSFITSPLSFVATANAALMIPGRDVRFCDVSPQTGNMEAADPLWQEWVVPVHFAGRAADLSRVNTKANEGRIIEDGAQALGAVDFDGCSRVGSCAHSLATIFSLHPTKPITSAEGGIVTTNDDGFAQLVRSLRDHGRENGLMVRIGVNGRMDEMSAALGLSQLKRCDEMRERRIHLACTYDNLFRTASLGERVYVPLPITTHGGQTIPRKTMGPAIEAGAYHLYPIRIKNGRRDEVKAKMQAAGIGVQKHYDPIIPLHPYYRNRFGYKPGDFPNAEAFASEELSLPLHAGMSDADVVRVVDALKEALR